MNNYVQNPPWLIKFIGLFLVLFIVLNGVFTLTITKMGAEYVNLNNETVNKTIDEFGEIDLSHLCKLTQCDIIWKDDKYYQMQNKILRRVSNENDKMYKMINDNIIYSGDDWAFMNNDSIVLHVAEHDIHIVTDMNIIIKEFLNLVYIINLFVFLVFSIAFIINYINEKKRKLIDKLQLSGTLQEKNMQILTENIHHELNTPLAIISGMLQQHEKNLKKYISKIPPCSETNIACSKNKVTILNIDFDTVYASIDQIQTVLQRMNDFKQIRYSNGNRNIASIIKYSLNSMNVYKRSNFTNTVDKIFKNYTLDKNFANGDFLNILSNFLRNSLEAKSTFIKIDGHFENGFMHLFIVDNGEGIFDRDTNNIIEQDNYNKIFEPYYSSKDTNGERKIQILSPYKKLLLKLGMLKNEPSQRGVGLYLNQQLMSSKKGKIKLIETSSSGTVFELMFPAKEFNK